MILSFETQSHPRSVIYYRMQKNYKYVGIETVIIIENAYQMRNFQVSFYFNYATDSQLHSFKKSLANENDCGKDI